MKFENEKKRILVAEEEEPIRKMLFQIFSKMGYQVTLAASGEQGLKFFCKEKHCVVFTDLDMPGMDGWKVLSVLKGNPLLSDIPIIMTSMIEERNKGIILGAEDYLVKPVTRHQLAITLSKYHIGDESQNLVMIIDDDDIVRDTMAEILKLSGWRVFKAENGRVALEQLENKKPSIILLDLLMPEMDGFEFLQRLREQEKWRSIPVIVLTATKLSVASFFF